MDFGLADFRKYPTAELFGGSRCLATSESARVTRVDLLAKTPGTAQSPTRWHNRIDFLLTPTSHFERATGAGAERPRRAESLSYASRGRDSDAAAELAHIDAPHRNPQCLSRPPAVLDSGGDDRRLAETA